MEAAEALLSEALWPPADAVSLQKENPEAEESNWRLEAYFEEAPDKTSVEEFLAAAIDGWGAIGPAQLETLPDQDWVAHALEGLGIVEAGRFILYGVHDKDKVPQNPRVIPIRIDANQAFGTGHHPTTEGCLKALDALADDHNFQNILDLGTGSAVLSIAAAKVWEARILATDIDEKSVEIAIENIGSNNAAGRVACRVADGFQHSELAARAPFDLILANILAGPLKDLAPGVCAHAAPGATVVLAGLLADQLEGVRDAYKAEGFTVVTVSGDRTWPILTLRKAA